MDDQFRPGPRPTPRPARRGVAVLVSALALTVTGTLAACSPETGAPAGAPSPAADQKDGTPGEVWSTGLNGDGQLGRPRNDVDVALGPVVAGQGRHLTDVVAVAAGDRHSLALTKQGRVMAWGANANGQLGNGTGKPSFAPVAVRAPGGASELQDVTAIAASGGLSMALRRNGSVVTWGSNGHGQRGSGSRKSSKFPTLVRSATGRGALTGVTAIAAGDHNGLALLRGGAVVAWGSNRAGLLGDGGGRDRGLPGPVRGAGGSGRLAGVAQISVGSKHVLARLGDGRVLTWGANDRGQLGDGTGRPRTVPGAVADPGGGGLDEVTFVAAGGKHNYAVHRDGTVLAWGDNANGQLGNGTTKPAPRPVHVAGTHTESLRGVSRMGAGQGYGVAVLVGGSALTWGVASKGQLGSGNRVARTRPGPLVAAKGARISTITNLAAGARHLLLLVRPRGTE
ncbi:RCC1-like domain-containing protein [Actinomadura sp. 9N407]|uniref:RCC1-like domain-containing protein n=1 Tax=Actinomadura sp. 9N407 TaxID=3375154 RepID=UPI00379D3299